ncbi:popeye domain-containing 2 isoform X1 [Pangasianodon hypophthalmus]|uniref:popeye domain-containing 2 isoform X1 n=1 Tax=Pangasianodon hypophthalmus TaxID=310915 RepID=UPI0023076A09|nr:popeye domain-containing 2 isoform X1 [Pangasianodon hypophthalmus]XP_026768662.3 popeye domain-containing 2 isoform X1 [Pangasianodon hypophthalmus]
MSSTNFSFDTIIYGHSLCTEWTNSTEGAIYHLGNTILFLGYMGGSGTYGALYIFSFLAPAFLCLALWGWLSVCGLDVFLWNLLLMLQCLAQVCHLIFRLLRDGLANAELSALYSAVYLPLAVPVQVFKEITAACENKVLALKAEETYAIEGKTPIDQLSFLLSGRIRVSLEGQFLHYIFPHQFLDSPEWESLRPTEEGNFQVTLTAETDCHYISWRRRRLYLLLAKDRYIARLFSVMLGSDIADKLYSLNDKLFAKSGVHLDIRLPSLYHVLAPSPPSSEGGSGCSPPRGSQGNQTAVPVDPAPSTQNVGAASSQQGQRKDPLLKGQPSQRHSSWAADPEMPSGEDSTSLVLEDFADMIGSLVDYGSERDYLK